MRIAIGAFVSVSLMSGSLALGQSSSPDFILRRAHMDGGRMSGASSGGLILRSVYIGAGAHFQPTSSASFRLRVLGIRTSAASGPLDPPGGCSDTPNFCSAPQALPLGYAAFTFSRGGLATLRLHFAGASIDRSSGIGTGA